VGPTCRRPRERCLLGQEGRWAESSRASGKRKEKEEEMELDWPVGGREVGLRTRFGPRLAGGLPQLELKKRKRRGGGPGPKERRRRVGLKEKEERELERGSLRGFFRTFELLF
jgi:hypothetical protein